jgi:hypothetical protein
MRALFYLKCSNSAAKVAVLVDEYGKPYIGYADEPVEAEKVRDTPTKLIMLEEERNNFYAMRLEN